MTRDEALKLLRGGEQGIQEWNRRQKDLELLVGCQVMPELKDIVLAGHPELSATELVRPDLSAVDLSEADLSGAYLTYANLVRANLRHANLCAANLAYANLVFANLSDANLSHADLIWTNLSFADLSRATLKGAFVVGAAFGHVDLATTEGLEAVKLIGASSIDVGTIVASKGRIPDDFLRGCGLRDEEIVYFRSVVSKPIRFYSCFICYSTQDEGFASRLHDDFQAKGIRCWKWNVDARTGRSLIGEIDQAIRDHDKVVLIASESSLKSPAVIREVRRAIDEEGRRAKDKEAGKFDGDINVLFPVAVDGFLFEEWQHELRSDVLDKVAADARDWQTNPAVYPKVRDRLIKDLKPT